MSSENWSVRLLRSCACLWYMVLQFPHQHLSATQGRLIPLGTRLKRSELNTPAACRSACTDYLRVGRQYASMIDMNPILYESGLG